MIRWRCLNDNVLLYRGQLIWLELCGDLSVLKVVIMLRGREFFSEWSGGTLPGSSDLKFFSTLF